MEKKLKTKLSNIRLKEELQYTSKENSFDYGPQRSDESNESYKKRIESALDEKSPDDYGPPKSDDDEQQKKAQGKPVEDNVKVINIDKADTSSSEQLIGEDLSFQIFLNLIY